MSQRIPVAVIGVGLVGGEFLSQLLSLPSPSPFVLVAVTSSKKLLYDPNGLPNPSEWRAALARSETPLDLAGLVRRLPPGRAIVVDNTASHEVAALAPACLRAGVSFVTPNKKGVSETLERFLDVVGACEGSGAAYLHESTVGAGLPIISTLKEMIATGDEILKIEGVFSGTLSYIFNEFSKASVPAGTREPTFSSVVADARQKGYTEPNPGDDLNGVDVARKLTILSRLIPKLVHALLAGYKDVQTRSLVPEELKGTDGDEFMRRLPEFDATFDELRKEARKEGKVLRYVGVVDVVTGQIKASLEKFPTSHPFATSLGGSDNIISIQSERYSPRPLIIQGAGAGAAVTAMGVLGDCLKLAGKHDYYRLRK